MEALFKLGDQLPDSSAATIGDRSTVLSLRGTKGRWPAMSLLLLDLWIVGINIFDDFVGLLLLLLSLQSEVMGMSWCLWDQRSHLSLLNWKLLRYSLSVVTNIFDGISCGVLRTTLVGALCGRRVCWCCGCRPVSLSLLCHLGLLTVGSCWTALLSAYDEPAC